ERGLFLPFVVDLEPAAGRDAEVGDSPAALGEAQLRIAGEVAGDGDGVGHGSLLAGDPGAQAEAPVSTRPRRAASASGRRISLWRTTSSARRSERSKSSRAPGSATRLKTT